MIKFKCLRQPQVSQLSDVYKEIKLSILPNISSFFRKVKVILQSLYKYKDYFKYQKDMKKSLKSISFTPTYKNPDILLELLTYIMRNNGT